MKKIISKSFAAVIVCAVIGQMPLLAQIKTTFTPEVRSSNSKPTGFVPAEHVSERNTVDVALPNKTRGIERYKKLNIWGKSIPDSFLFYRRTLNQNQKAVYDVAYKALMQTDEGASLPVGLTEDEFFDVMVALQYDNPEAFWWAGHYSYRTNSDDTVTSFTFKNWLETSKIEQEYEKFWKATSPLIFYASTLQDDMSKIKYIHDYICLSTEYDYDSYNAGNTGGKLQTAYSCAVEYKTVCAGYTALFSYYMQQLGIPCTYLSSNGHAWNFLKVDGQFYQMDVTWNDAEIIPPYYNLTHEEMAKIKSHTPAPLSKKVVDSYPSTGNQMSYLEYFGALVEGSPYTYKELNYFDYEKSFKNTKSVKIYRNEPESYDIVKNADELKRLINWLYGSDYYDGTVFKFYVPSEDELNKIVERLKNGEICNWHEGSRSYAGSGYIYSLTLASSNKPSEK